MKNSIYKIILLALVFVYFLSPSYGQIQEAACGTPSSGGISAPFVPTSGTFKILVIMCKFKDDNFNQSPHTNLWPSSQSGMPSFASSLVSGTVQTSYPNPSFSGFYHDMSGGDLDVIGDVVFYEPDSVQSYYFRPNGRHIGYLTEEILNGVNSSVNYADYDNDNDGDVDMIQICFRFSDNYNLDYNFTGSVGNGDSYQGVASLTGPNSSNFGSGNSTLTLDGKTIRGGNYGSGIFQNGCISAHDAVAVMSHEFGHYLLGGGHYTGVGFHGIMDGNGSGVMHSYEKEILGWLSPTTVSSNLTNITLTDALTTDCVYKIPISGTSEYFLVENHQRVNYYESSYLKYNSGPLRSPGTGVLVSHIRPAQTSKSNRLDIESAFGRWNWKKSGSQYVFPFEVNTPNRASGEDKLNLRVKNTTSGEQTHADFLGSQSDFFTVDYNTVFSPWSNPSAYPNTSDIAVVVKEVSGVIKADFYVSNAVNAPPSKPQNLKVVSQSNHPYLTWDANLESDIYGYYIYRSENGGAYQYIDFTSSTSYTDNEVTTYQQFDDFEYKISATDTYSSSVYSDIVSIQGVIPKTNINTASTSSSEFSLSQNYPNPFNPTTIISYNLPQNGFVTLKIYDVLGKEIANLVNENKEAGYYSVEFNASHLPSGVYFYKVTAGNFSEIKKMLLLK